MSFSLRRLLQRRRTQSGLPDGAKKPYHIAIIMDGNGRWARQRGLPRTAGHRAGMAALRRTVRAAAELGIGVLTVYAFSTENWRRPKTEVDFLMNLPRQFLKTDLPELKRQNVRIRMSGNREGLPVHTLQAVDEAMVQTAGNTGMILNFALNYGSRAEIIQAFRRLAQAVKAGTLEPEEITEETVSRALYTGDLPDPDLLIRCSGEIRLSNFLLWQLAYAELWFTDVYWPDFNRSHLLAAITAYSERDRRFGGVKNREGLDV